MKKLGLLVLGLAIGVSLSSFCYADAEYGVLKVISNQTNSRIYIDGNFEGNGNVSRDKIIVGNHLIQVKNANKDILFEEMVSVRANEQTTVVAKAGEEIQQNTQTEPQILEQSQPAQIEAPNQYQISNQPAKYHSIFGLEASYGTWNLNFPGYGSIQSGEPIKEVGLYIKTIAENKGFAKASFHYILPVSGASTNVGTFVGLDIGAQSDLIEASIGMNYLITNVSNSIGRLGYQAFLGFKVANATIGAKYLVLNATDSGGYYYSSTSYSYSQLLLGASIDFGQ